MSEQQQAPTKDNEEKVVSVDNLDPYDSNQIVNSPRSLTACKKLGFLPEQLRYKTLDQFIKEEKSEEIGNKAYNIKNKKRIEDIEKVRTERARLIKKEMRPVS